MKPDSVTLQRDYYTRTADDYDHLHLLESEHALALSYLSGLMDNYAFSSLLDIGAGTGRVIRHLRKNRPDLTILGVEPVDALRKVACNMGVPENCMVSGDACALDFPDDSWDMVCSFGVLHHIPEPSLAVKEMCRVAKHAIFISDLNNFGCGSIAQRILSQGLRMLGLWKAFQWIKNGGKFDKYSEGDGVHYSYSVFDSLPTLRNKFPLTYLSNTRGSGDNLYRQCSHLSVFAVKSRAQLDAMNIYAK